jgi:hypothetical protein
LLEHGASRAHEIKKPARLDVGFEKRAARRLLIDVSLLDVYLTLLQKTSGVAAGCSGGLPVKRRLGHPRILLAADARISASQVQ